MTTMAECLADVRARLDEAAAGFWTDPQLRRWINQGVIDIARRAETTQLTTTKAVVALTQQYVFTERINRVNRVEYVQTGNTNTYVLEFRLNNNMDEIWWTNKTNSPGIPGYFSLYGAAPAITMTLYPSPSTTGVLTVYYYGLPVELAIDGSADASTIAVPMGWNDAVALYCEFNALRKDADPRWQEAKGLYEEKLGELVDVSRTLSDQAQMLVSDYTPGGPAWWLYSE